MSRPLRGYSMLRKLLIISILTPFLLNSAPIDRARMRVAEEAMREREKSLADAHSVYYAPAPCPRIVRDVLKKFAEMHGEECQDLELIPCSEGSITLEVSNRPRWQEAVYNGTSDRIIAELKPILEKENIPGLYADRLARLTPLNEGRYADLLQVCIPKNKSEEPTPRAETTTIRIAEEALKKPENGFKIFRYSALHPSHEQVYSKEFAALLARMLGAREKKKSA